MLLLMLLSLMMWMCDDVLSCKGALIDIRLDRIFMLEFQLGSVICELCGCLCACSCICVFVCAVVCLNKL